MRTFPSPTKSEIRKIFPNPFGGCSSRQAGSAAARQAVVGADHGCSGFGYYDYFGGTAATTSRCCLTSRICLLAAEAPAAEAATRLPQGQEGS